MPRKMHIIEKIIWRLRNKIYIWRLERIMKKLGEELNKGEHIVGVAGEDLEGGDMVYLKGDKFYKAR